MQNPQLRINCSPYAVQLLGELALLIPVFDEFHDRFKSATFASLEASRVVNY
jgi:hypothetical protein